MYGTMNINIMTITYYYMYIHSYIKVFHWAQSRNGSINHIELRDDSKRYRSGQHNFTLVTGQYYPFWRINEIKLSVSHSYLSLDLYLFILFNYIDFGDMFRHQVPSLGQYVLNNHCHRVTIQLQLINIIIIIIIMLWQLILTMLCIC
jgi:hypothetical protein